MSALVESFVPHVCTLPLLKPHRSQIKGERTGLTVNSQKNKYETQPAMKQVREKHALVSQLHGKAVVVM